MNLKGDNVIMLLSKDQVQLIADAVSLATHELHDRWETISGFEKLNELKHLESVLRTYLKTEERDVQENED